MAGDGLANQPLLLPFDGVAPSLAAGAWVAPGATVVGAVTLGEETSIWYGAVLRGDGDRIDIGRGSNVQDGAVVHADPGFPARLGAGVLVGHRAVVHGATVGDNVLVGMGSIVMNGATIGDDVVVGAGAVVVEGLRIPDGCLVTGVPARVRRPLTAEEIDGIRDSATTYLRLMRQHRSASQQDS